MDPPVNVDPDAGLDAVACSVGEKRPIENGEVSSVKKQRCGTPGAMKRVAEIVLVLSAMAKMRGGGRGPTDVELGLMAEARERLVEICGDLAPGDIVGRDAVAAVIEDLGLNAKAKEQRLGFRMPRLTISERFSIAKKKMEESKKFQASTPTYTSQLLQTSISGSSHTLRSFPSDRPNHAPISFSSSPAPVTATSSSPVPYHLSTSSAVNSGLPSSHLGRDSSLFGFPRGDRSQVKLEGSNVGPANPSANHPLVNAPTWSIQSQPGALTKPGQENKALNHNLAKSEGSLDMSMSRLASQAARDQNFRPFITQSSSGTLSMHSMNHLQGPPLNNNHNEIAKIVQKLLQPKLPEHPTWTPPSREYMNKALTCQTCKFTINEVETVLICDACEKGFHLKCLQAHNQKGIPRGEWHCTRCLSLCNGKPLPPKYGRVMRSINMPKAQAPSNTAAGQSNTAEAQSSSENKEGNPDAKVNQPKITENGSTGLQPPVVPGTTGSNSVQSAFDSKIPNGKNLSSIEKQRDQAASTGTCPNSGSLVVSSSEKSSEHPHTTESATNEERGDPESKSQPLGTLSDTIKEEFDHSQASQDMQDVRMGKQNSADVPIKQNEQDATVTHPIQSSGPSTEVTNHTQFSFDGLHAIDWIGDVTQVLDGKKFYKSCCIGGVIYKVQDHALFRFSNGKLIPSKLQAMWEEIKTGLKFIDVRRCYFPSDLPETVGRPYTPEGSEVYESNNDITIMAGLIQGPCEVLPASKFKEESEKQIQLEVEGNKGSRSIFLCKWLYDESKGSFQPVSG
ncbi:hypothetical protein SLE2022_018860 [Rubroshorea leprosula]